MILIKIANEVSYVAVFMIIEKIEELLSCISWDKVHGLLPVIIQDADNYNILMLGYMNEEALKKTLQEGIVTFYSRSKKRLWTKGESSGNYLKVKKYFLDCDNDALLILVNPIGVVCHKGSMSCFKQPLPFVQELSKVIDDRFQNGTADSYVKKLHDAGKERIAQKVGEEALEVAIASVTADKNMIIEETADLLFHMLVNLRYHNISWQEIINTLMTRAK
jgi:phosphoribosyl-ATP pyrophosphohydrolase/phosphoribosyl-AMP cyclohydrolase